MRSKVSGEGLVMVLALLGVAILMWVYRPGPLVVAFVVLCGLFAASDILQAIVGRELRPIRGTPLPAKPAAQVRAEAAINQLFYSGAALMVGAQYEYAVVLVVLGAIAHARITRRFDSRRDDQH